MSSMPRARRVLVVEDDSERIAMFKRQLGTEAVFVTDHAGAARALAAGRKFDEVFLDFDIDDASHNGQDVAYLLTRLPARLRPRRVTLHSTNLRGALGMKQILEQAGIRVVSDPFPPACLRVEVSDGR